LNFNTLCFILILLPSIETDQNTSPLELPIHGDTNNEISLELVYQKTEPVFEVIGKKLKLLKPLDRDKDNLSHIIFQVCVFKCLMLNKKKSLTRIF
jgi:hypothetical protein